MRKVVLWLVLALGRWTSVASSVRIFLVLFAALFLLYAVAASDRFGRRLPVRTIFAFAVAFRLVVLFAGLPPSERAAGLRDDLTSASAGYETFILYDNDVWRYLWDGHVLARGVNPYSVPPAPVEDDPELLEIVDDPDYPTRPLRAIVFHVEQLDMNCPKRIPVLLPAEAVEEVLGKLQARVVELEEQLAAARA